MLVDLGEESRGLETVNSESYCIECEGKKVGGRRLVNVNLWTHFVIDEWWCSCQCRIELLVAVVVVKRVAL